MSVLGNLEAFSEALEERFKDHQEHMGRQDKELNRLHFRLDAILAEMEGKVSAKQDETGGKETAALWKRIFQLEAQVNDLCADLSRAESKIQGLLK